MRKTRILALVLLTATALVVGCSKNVKVKGTVSYADDGAPVSSGMIYFVNGDFNARGQIENGEFVVTSVKQGDGLPPGNYQVYFGGVEEVVREAEELPNGETTEPVTQASIDLKYFSADSSGLTQTIDKSTKTVDFKLDRANF